MKTAAPADTYNEFRLSPDEKSVVFTRYTSSTADIWVRDLVRGATRRFTFDPAVDNLPIWSSDGSRILWPSRRLGGTFDLYIKRASGTGQDKLLIKIGTPIGSGMDWSRDGKFILYQKPSDQFIRDIWIAPQIGDKKPFPYLQSQYNKQDAMFSPDARWIAYSSDETGSWEVYVQAFPLTGEKKKISNDGGAAPTWGKDGAELFYRATDGNLMAVPVRIDAKTVETGEAKALFQTPGIGTGLRVSMRTYAVSGDGQRFLIGQPVGDTATPVITVIVNWTEELRQRVQIK